MSIDSRFPAMVAPAQDGPYGYPDPAAGPEARRRYLHVDIPEMDLADVMQELRAVVPGAALPGPHQAWFWVRAAILSNRLRTLVTAELRTHRTRHTTTSP